MTERGHWSYDGAIPDECFGFIYEIECTVTSKKYIGKKQMRRCVKLRPLKGKRNKRHQIVESDWKEYTGSCNDLNADIIAHGKSAFTFKIIKLCTCKWELAYEEARLQFERHVLLREDYYNGILNCRIGKKPKSMS